MKFKTILPVVALVFAAAACNRNVVQENPIATPAEQAQTPQPEQMSASETPAPTPAPVPAPAPASVIPQPIELTSAEIVISDSGFTPKDVTIKKGGTMTFVNNSSKVRWPASAPHPTHTDYPGFDPLKGIAPGQSWSFTFEKTGTWKYHDHLQPTFFGSVTVTE